MTTATLNAVKGEILYSGSGNPKLNAVKMEVLYHGSGNPKLNAVKLEVLYSNVGTALPRRTTVVVSK